LEQQRTRRYKSWYQTEISRTIFKNSKPDVWNTTAITPGTIFMKELNDFIMKHFTEPSKYGVEKLIVSTSNECGEGEHKIFDYIRNNINDHFDKSTVIYGLDADLIMLSINHLPIAKEIYLFRETPHFIQSINKDLEPNENYVMDIPELARIITNDMQDSEESKDLVSVNRVYDYIFLCFFLGNDFLPHFPAVNIRTGGVDKMLNAYKATIGSTKEVLTDGKTIYWNNVRKLVKHLADLEEEYSRSEMKLRDKREKIYYPTDTPENIYKKFDAIPNYERELEKYINPFKDGWRERYYKSLFPNSPFTKKGSSESDWEEETKKISMNYLEGLEWTMKYYTTGCPDWRWFYHYSYPPLFKDLIHFVPIFEKELVPFIKPMPVCPLVQLCYVLPLNSLKLLPPKLYDLLIKKYADWYKMDCEFIWAFCRYFWESHVQLPEIDINELEQLVLHF
jgi:5'-3' exonuclease